MRSRPLALAVSASIAAIFSCSMWTSRDKDASRGVIPGCQWCQFGACVDSPAASEFVGLTPLSPTRGAAVGLLVDERTLPSAPALCSSSGMVGNVPTPRADVVPCAGGLL